MAYGGQILRSDGTYWLTPDQTPLNMVKRQDVNYANTSGIVYYDTGVATSRPCCVFQRITSGDGDSRNFGGYLIQRNGTWQFQMNGVQGPITVRWYVFSNYVVAPTAYDIAYYNASGTAVWNGSSRPLQLYRTTVSRSNSVSGGYTVLNAGQTVAIMPSFSGSAIEGGTPGPNPEYFIGTYCYKAVGNLIKLDLASMNITTDGTYVPFYIGVCFYIRTALYDL